MISPGSVSAMLLGGRPLLNIPLQLEQAILSRRVADLGAGLVAEPNRPEQMAARLVAILQNRSFREAAQSFADRYANYNPDATIESVFSKIGELLNA